MADLSISQSLRVERTEFLNTFSRSSTADMATAGMLVQTIGLGTQAVTISTANLNTLGFAFGQSLVSVTQATATITFGRYVGGTLHDMAVVRPGEAFLMRLAPGTYAAKAADEGYRLQLAVVEG